MKCILFLLSLTCGLGSAYSQDTTQHTVQQMIETATFRFVPRTMYPAGGRARQLTTEYFVTLSSDSLVSDLPYFGRSYSANIGTQGGIQFTSTKFELRSSKNKKDGWTIVIKPNDVNDPRQLTFFISSAGNTTLNITSNNRQAISYAGEIIHKKIN